MRYLICLLLSLSSIPFSFATSHPEIYPNAILSRMQILFKYHFIAGATGACSETNFVESSCYNYSNPVEGFEVNFLSYCYRSLKEQPKPSPFLNKKYYKAFVYNRKYEKILEEKLNPLSIVEDINSSRARFDIYGTINLPYIADASLVRVIKVLKGKETILANIGLIRNPISYFKSLFSDSIKENPKQGIYWDQTRQCHIKRVN